MPYEFRKIYADLVADDGTVVILYLTWVRLGLWQARAGLEVYHPDGRREAAEGLAKPPRVDPAAPLACFPLEVVLPDGTFTLRADIEDGAWAPIVASPVPALQWTVKAARARMTARWALTGGDRELTGPGYVDHVRLTRATRGLGLRTLRWGRAHLPGRTVVFEDLELRDGRRWRVGLDTADREATSLALDVTPTGEAWVGLHDGTLELSPERVLHEGDAFGPDRLPRRLDRMVCQAIGGPTFESRWLGRAWHAGDEGPALWERVRFGAPA